MAYTVNPVTYKYVSIVFLIKKQAGQVEDLAFAVRYISKGNGKIKNKIRKS